MALADNSGNDGAGNGGRNRGRGGATTINHNAAVAEAKPTVVAGAMDVVAAEVAAAGAAAAVAAAVKIQWQGQIVAAAALCPGRNRGSKHA